MNYFYRTAITKQSLGTAILHKEPPFQGHILAKVTDLATQGDFKIIVVNCDNAQHQFNINLPSVQNLEEEEVTKSAPLYQPEQATRQLNPETHKEEQVVIPAANLTRFYSNSNFIKSKIAEASQLFSGIRTELMSFYSDTGRFPDNLSEIPTAMTSGSYVNLSYKLSRDIQPIVRVTLKEGTEIPGGYIEWTFQPENGQWNCHSPNIADKFLPKGCK